ncbi:MYCBP-associated protein [Bagarius yarrelli]|uniref:MYCBP-associated protein n=1 Tax=Bagarius yarrelli TaxID=175774 RepID=A0A556TL81_BAGYA|nr:MYCBP-associated protein [Bagarius yarrelli]
MASGGKAAKAAKKESRVPDKSPPDKKQGNMLDECQNSVNEEQSTSPAVNEEDIQTLSIRPEHLEKLRTPQPPKDSQKPRATSRVLVRKTRPPAVLSNGVRVAMAKRPPNDAELQPLDYTGPGGPRFDAQGMVLPHSILGSLEDFRKEMEIRGEVELVRRTPDVKKQQPLTFEEQKSGVKTKSWLSSRQDHQEHALSHWCYHMAERRRQQNFISNLLQKPVEELLMNQSDRFRETQEQRELISRGLPIFHYGYGARVGSEFWSVPQRYGDELSGIMATLTQKERGHVKPITQITQPHSTRQESGNVLSERSSSRAWSHSQYLKQRQNELRNVLNDLEYNQDPLARFDDLIVNVALLPALRISGELACWIGSTTSHQGEIGVSVCLTFEAVAGESSCSHLELKNEGSTAIYYSWQKLELPHRFPEAKTQRHTQHFYFNTATAMILPGDIVRILFTFKSMHPGIMKEAWKLHTHPVLMGGAELQVTLNGIALYLDKTAEQRAAIELELQRREAWSVCSSLLFELLDGIRTPERPRSPAELSMTEEEQFKAQNPDLHYHHAPVEALKSLWKQAKITDLSAPEECTYGWDLSLSSLYQVILCLPPGDADTHKEGTRLCREKALGLYNTLLLQLYQSQPVSIPLTPYGIGLQLWRELLDGLSSEALRLRRLLGLSENPNWGDPQQESDSKKEPKKEEVIEKKAAPLSKDKEEKKGAGKPTAKEKAAEVYVLMEKMIDSFGKLLEEAEENQENLHDV